MLAKNGNLGSTPGGASETTPFRAAPRHGIRRVLMTADSVGGVWPYSLDLATAFRDRGIETTLAVMGPAMERGQREDAVQRGIGLAQGPFKLEWEESPWDDVRRAGDWLLEVAARVRPEL